MAGDEVVKALEDLFSRPQSDHWFCPRDASDPDGSYFDEDVLESLGTETEEEKQRRLSRLDPVHETRRTAIHATQIFAFDGAEATAYQDKLKEALAGQLSRCSVCVRQFHRFRAELKHFLEEEYESEMVEAFMQRYDKVNIHRMIQGLDSARDTLLDTEPDSRSIKVLSVKELFALFEAMHCEPFLYNEPLLVAHFDQAFRLMQSKVKVSLPEYSPALTIFLFSKNNDRLQWALRGWRKFKRGPTGEEFDWTIRDNLKAAMARVNILALEKDFMPTFWQAVHLIVKKLDQRLITHHLKAIDVDLCRLALDHLQVESDCFLDLLGTLRVLLEVAPADTWDSFGTIPPQTVVEQIFNSPSFEDLLISVGNLKSQDLETALGWVDPFLYSIKPASLPSVCRAITNQLMTKFQQARIPETSRHICQQKGEYALLLVLDSMQRQHHSGASIAALLEMLRSHILTLLNKFKGLQDQSPDLKHRTLALQIIQKTLALDCSRLQLDRAAIVGKKVLSHDITTVSGDIWTALVQGVRSANIELAAAVLEGASQTLVLEKLTAHQIETTPKYAKPWNDVVSVIQNSLVELLERMQDFASNDLQKMFAAPATASVIFASLFSGDSAVQQAATSMLKVASSESSRRDCIRFLLDNYYTTTLTAMSHTLKLIAQSQVFMPTLMVLKLGTDLIESLCNSQDGLLRTRQLTQEEKSIMEHAWDSLWVAISTMFEHTEAWSNMGYEKSLLVEFCRDAMDFADKAFDQYSVISGALHTSGAGQDKTKLDKRLLTKPQEAADHMVKWLRLRDEYLIAKAVSLAGRVMGRLHDVGLELSDDAVTFIDDIAAGATKNKLTVVQRAELRRALDKHLEDERVVEQVEVKPQKQGSLQNWMSTDVKPNLPAGRKLQAINFDAWKLKAAQPTEPRQRLPATERAKIVKPGRLDSSGGRTTASFQPIQRITQAKSADPSEFKRKRLAEQEAKRKRDLAAIAAVKGARAGIAGAGSGVSGIGVEGKSHAVNGQSVMVSSDEESDDGGLDEELFGPSEKQAKAKAVPTSKISHVIPEPKGPVRVQRKHRSQKDMQARLKPDLSSLHKTILGWDLFHEGEYPPNSGDWQYQKVSPFFRHVEAYRETFQPLLTLEAWQGLVRSREENSAKPFELKISSRSSVDSFVEISTAISPADNKELQMSEGDIIFFSEAKQPLTAPDAPHCLSRVHRVNRKKGLIEVVYRVVSNNPLLARLTPGSTVSGVKIQSVIPLEREYGALVGLQYYDLCTQIIKAQPSPLLDYTDKQIRPLMANYNVNMAQAKAIRSAVDNDAFTLIQGPPGSGKTKTIVAIVGALIGDTVGSAASATEIKMPKSASSSMSAPRKLLVCAPSNAAVDELVMRLKEGIKTKEGTHKKINVLRLGRSDAINAGVVDVTLDELVNKRLGKSSGDSTARDKTQALMKQHQKVSEQLRAARDEAEKGASDPEATAKLNDNVRRLRKLKNDLGNQIDSAKDAEGAANRSVDLQRRKVQQAVLDEAHVICATLSGSGHDMFQSVNIEFETVVVDEAAQCVEMSALIPLKYGCAKCILVGDPKQLPPTVFSKEAARFQYEQSLFVRMQGNFPESVHLLDTQYRMHPDISAFPSAAFYDGKLLDGPDMAALRQRPWHASSLLAPYRFFDVEGQHSSAPKGHSLINRAEVEVALALYNRITTDFSDYDFTGKIGIITPYRSQLALLKDRFQAQYSRSILQHVEFNTTDAFQGRESEIIIFSCVRASPAGNIGFLQDIRRMNVGLTRAKSSLWVLGNGQSLMRGEYWRKLVVHSRERGAYVSGNITAMLQQPQRLGKPSGAPVAPMMTSSNSEWANAQVVPTGPRITNAPLVPGGPKSMNSHGTHKAPPVMRPVERLSEARRVSIGLDYGDEEEGEIRENTKQAPKREQAVRTSIGLDHGDAGEGEIRENTAQAPKPEQAGRMTAPAITTHGLARVTAPIEPEPTKNGREPVEVIDVDMEVKSSEDEGAEVSSHSRKSSERTGKPPALASNTTRQVIDPPRNIVSRKRKPVDVFIRRPKVPKR